MRQDLERTEKVWRSAAGKSFPFSDDLNFRKLLMRYVYEALFPEELGSSTRDNVNKVQDGQEELTEPLLVVNRGNAIGKPTLMMEFALNESLESDVLVSGAKKMTVWVPQQKVREFKYRVRAAIRPVGDYGQFFRTVVHEVYSAGRKYKWGNVQPMTTLGIKRMLGHVRGYGLTDVIILVAEGSPLADEMVLDVQARAASWMDPSFAVVVPQDRSYLGDILELGDHYVGLVHNPERGIAVAYDGKVAPG
jgi:hypothetical protein